MHSFSINEHLVAFVKAVQAKAIEGGGRQELTLGSLFGTSAKDTQPSLTFGYGYYDGDKVLWRIGQKVEQLSAEDAVDRFLAFHRLN